MRQTYTFNGKLLQLCKFSKHGFEAGYQYVVLKNNVSYRLDEAKPLILLIV